MGNRRGPQIKNGTRLAVARTPTVYIFRGERSKIERASTAVRASLVEAFSGPPRPQSV